jgi:hypothetical protein
MKLLLNFLPIIIIFLLVSYSDQMAQWSHTILGKFFAILLILFYTKIDVLSGLVVCALVILYYQTDFVEGFAPKSEIEGFSTPESDNDVSNDTNEGNEPEIDSFEILDDAYPDTPTEPVLYESKVDRFRQKHCSKGHLVHKGQHVSNEMAEHVFPEIEQKDFHKCNICDYSCDFKFIDRKIQVQDQLIKPLSGRETR